jgi:hypothetical protein
MAALLLSVRCPRHKNSKPAATQQEDIKKNLNEKSAGGIKKT